MSRFINNLDLTHVLIAESHSLKLVIFRDIRGFIQDWNLTNVSYTFESILHGYFYIKSVSLFCTYLFILKHTWLKPYVLTAESCSLNLVIYRDMSGFIQDINFTDVLIAESHLLKLVIFGDIRGFIQDCNLTHVWTAAIDSL